MKNTKPQRPKANEFSFDPWIIWIAFRRNWFWTIPLGAVIAVIAGGYVYQSFVPWYRASALLQANREYVIFQGVMQGPDDVVQTERPLIYNHLILSSVLANKEVCEAPSLRDPVTREANLRRNLIVHDAGAKSMMFISYRDTDPQAAAKVCNFIVDAYLSQRQRFDDRRISDLESWLQPALKHWQGEMQDRQTRIIALSKQARGFNPFQESSKLEADTGHLASLRDELSRLRSEEAVYEAELAQMRASAGVPRTVNESELSDDSIETMVSRDRDVARLSRLLEDKQALIQRFETSGLARLKKEVFEDFKIEANKYSTELRQARLKAEVAAKEKLKDLYQKEGVKQTGNSIAAKEGQIASVQTRREVVEKNFAEEMSRLSKFAGETAELYFEQQNYLQASDVLKKLNDRVASLRTERQKSSTIQTISEAIPPTSPEEIAPWKKIFTYGLGAFAAPLVLAVAWEFMQKRVGSSNLLEASKDVPLIGEVSRLPAGIATGRNKRMYEESIESVRTNLMFTEGANKFQTFVIASSMSGEGKSSLASHLALSIARCSGQQVLLVDADIRSPDQHHLFGIENGKGLADVLSGTCSLSDAINRSLGERLHVLTAGTLETNPYRLMTPKLIEEVFEQMKSEYPYVVIDTAPVLAAGETLCLASKADATIVCVMRDHSRQDNVRRCLNRLEACGANVLGTVFGGTPSREYAQRYGDYRYMSRKSI